MPVVTHFPPSPSLRPLQPFAFFPALSPGSCTSTSASRSAFKFPAREKLDPSTRCPLVKSSISAWLQVPHHVPALSVATAIASTSISPARPFASSTNLRPNWQHLISPQSIRLSQPGSPSVEWTRRLSPRSRILSRAGLRRHTTLARAATMVSRPLFSAFYGKADETLSINRCLRCCTRPSFSSPRETASGL